MRSNNQYSFTEIKMSLLRNKTFTLNRFDSHENLLISLIVDSEAPDVTVTVLGKRLDEQSSIPCGGCLLFIFPSESTNCVFFPR